MPAAQLEVLGLGEPALARAGAGASARLASRGQILQRGGDVVVEDLGLAAGQFDSALRDDDRK